MDIIVVILFALVGWAVGKALASLIKTEPRNKKQTYIYHNHHYYHTTNNHLHISDEGLKTLNNQ